MLNIAAFMVVKNDEYYIDMALESVLPYVKGVYIQDQYSNDGTYEKIVDLANGNEKIIYEQISTGSNERFPRDYNEPKYRALAVQAAEDYFDPEWILKLDADEIYTPYFFSELEWILTADTGFNGVRVSGDRFISRTHRSVHPSAIETSPDGTIFIDPHTQVWRAKKGITYICNPRMTGYFHPILSPPPTPVYWLSGICNIHLHRMFGPKSYAFWSEGEEKPDKSIPFHPPTMCPNWYNSKVNMGCSEEVKFEWPAYVLRKWDAFGKW